MKKIATILLISVLVHYASAQNGLMTTHINLFKNGNYFVVKEGIVNTETGYWKLPLNNFNPLLSTFWASSTNENKLDRIEVKNDVVKKTQVIQSFDEALSYNKGAKIKLTYLLTINSEQTSSIEGILESYSVVSKTARIKTNSGMYVYVLVNNIIELAFTDAPHENFEKDSAATVAKFVFEKKVAKTPLKLSYMQTGISWSPGYNIRLSEEGKLFLQMNAVITNNSEDIVDADVVITLGAAAFKYANSLDPIIFHAAMSLASNYLPLSWNNQIYSNYVTSTTSTGSLSQAHNDITNEEYETEGEKSEDLYRYKLGHMTLPKDSRISTQIFGQKIPYEDVYETNIDDISNYQYTRTCRNNEGDYLEVFHSLRLHNTTTFPLSTGPVFVQDEKIQPLAQGQITYTSVGGKVKVQLAKASDIFVINNENEITLKSSTKIYDRRTYYLTEINGKVLIENMQNKNIKLNITKHINGSIEKVSDEGSIEKTGRYNQLNPQSKAEWIVELKPNEKKTITYGYEVFHE